MLGRDWVRAGVPEKAGARGRAGWAKTNGAGARVRAGVLVMTWAGAGGWGNSRLWAVNFGLTAGAGAGAGAAVAVAVALMFLLACPAAAGSSTAWTQSSAGPAGECSSSVPPAARTDLEPDLEQ